MRNTRFYRPVNEEFAGNFFGKIFPASLFCPFLPHRFGQNVFCSCSVKMQTLETDNPFPHQAPNFGKMPGPAMPES